MNVISVKKETSFADFVCHVLNICGKKEIVVIVAAANPRIVKKSIAIQTYKLKNSEVRMKTLDDLLAASAIHQSHKIHSVAFFPERVFWLLTPEFCFDKVFSD